MAKAGNKSLKTEKRKKKKKISFRNRRPEFFKVFLKRISSHRLSIPPAFIHHFNGTVPNKAILKHSTGRCCRVELEELKSRVFINSGWQSFVNDHSIEHGDFLIFKYAGDSLFEVTIFCPNGCVKEEESGSKEEKPSRRPPKPTAPMKVEEASGSKEVESPRRPTQNPKRETGPQEGEPSRRVTRNRKQKVSETSPEFENRGLERNRRRERDAEMHREVCKLFESEGLELPHNPFFLGSLSAPYNLYLPKYVISENHITMTKEIVIHGKNGKSWPVRVAFWTNNWVALTLGWTNFVRDNNLGPNDKFVLEFILCGGRICKELRAHLFSSGNQRGRRYLTRS